MRMAVKNGVSFARSPIPARRAVCTPGCSSISSKRTGSSPIERQSVTSVVAARPAAAGPDVSELLVRAREIASLARRHVVIMAHERRRFVERVDYVTSAGHGSGGDWRARTGLPGGGPSAVITTLGLFRFDPVTREMVLASAHPGVPLEEIRAQTGWPLRLAPDLGETPRPSAEELATIRRFDPDGFWTGARR